MFSGVKSWIQALTKKDLNRMVRWSARWQVNSRSGTLTREAVDETSVGPWLPTFPPTPPSSETAFCRPRPWLRSAPAAEPWLDLFHIFPCDSSHGKWRIICISNMQMKVCDDDSAFFLLFMDMNHQMDYEKGIAYELKINYFYKRTLSV